MSENEMKTRKQAIMQRIKETAESMPIGHIRAAIMNGELTFPMLHMAFKDFLGDALHPGNDRGAKWMD